MPDFTRVINLAYQRILGRPADPGGLDAYNRSMNAGLTEADMRESLLRSAEYAAKHPDRAEASTASTTSAGASKKTDGRSKSKSKSEPASRAAKTRAGGKKKRARARKSG